MAPNLGRLSHRGGAHGRPDGVAGVVGVAGTDRVVDGWGAPTPRSPARCRVAKPPTTSSEDTTRVATAARRDPTTSGRVSCPMCPFRRLGVPYVTRPRAVVDVPEVSAPSHGDRGAPARRVLCVAHTPGAPRVRLRRL